MSEGAVATSTRRGPPDFASLMHVDDFEQRECTANSSELAGYGRASQQLSFYNRENR